jgi:type IV fimbrial biogenesis protein FimT
MNKFTYGFTLIECLTVIAILFILVFSGTHYGIQFVSRYKAYSDKQNIYFALQLARQEAVRQNKTIFFCFLDSSEKCSKTGTQAVVIFLDTNNDKKYQDSELIQYFPLVVNNLFISQKVSGGRNYIRYRNRGTVKEIGNIRYCPDHNAMESAYFIINFGGRVRLGKDSDNDGIPNINSSTNMSC